MTPYEATRRLAVSRTLGDGRKVAVGTLAQNRDGVYFAYEAAYLQQHGNLSPYQLRADGSVQLAARNLPHGLHGVFADCLPDGWGMLLQDRHFRQQGILPAHVTALDRLAFIGDRGMGALGFEPLWQPQAPPENRDYGALGLAAQAVFDGQTEDVLQELIRVGSSGGARPKAQIWMAPDEPRHCRTVAQPGDEAWLVKYTSRHLPPLGHEEGLCEAAYLQLAERAGLQPCAWRLLDAPAKSGAKRWLARFGTTLINKRSATYRAHKAEVLAAEAAGGDALIALLYALPTLIKRPVIVSDADVWLGLDAPPSSICSLPITTTTAKTGRSCKTTAATGNRRRSTTPLSARTRAANT